jgi:hypothetical protein
MRAASARDYNIDHDIIASRGNDWRKAGVYQQQSAQATSSDAAYANHVLFTCMTGKGYRPRE